MGSVKKCFPTSTTIYGKHYGNGRKEGILRRAKSGFSENTLGKLEDTAFLSLSKPKIEEVMTK